MPAGKTPLTVRIFPLGWGFTVTVTSGLNRWEVQAAYSLAFFTACPVKVTLGMISYCRSFI